MLLMMDIAKGANGVVCRSPLRNSMCRLLVFHGLELKVFVIHVMVVHLLWFPGSPHRQMSGKEEAASVSESQRKGFDKLLLHQHHLDLLCLWWLRGHKPGTGGERHLFSLEASTGDGVVSLSL